MGVSCEPVWLAGYPLGDDHQAVERAKSSLGRGSDYNLFTNNCEHFAYYCKTGHRWSHQVQDVAMDATVFSLLWEISVGPILSPALFVSEHVLTGLGYLKEASVVNKINSEIRPWSFVRRVREGKPFWSWSGLSEIAKVS
jgi:hypothetical protein